jgi:hypothetical protein
MLWRNVQALMQLRWGRSNIRQLAEKAHVGEATIHRFKPEAVNWPGLDAIDKVAGVFRREAWQLLHPRPDARELSSSGSEIGHAYDRLPEDRKEAAYALIVQILEFGNVGPGPDRPSSTPTPELPDPPETRLGETRVAPSPRRKNGRSPERPRGR